MMSLVRGNMWPGKIEAAAIITCGPYRPRVGFWVPWFPYSLPQSWPFCWWVAVAIDQVSRRLIGFAAFAKPPTSLEVRQFLQRAIRASGRTPKYIVTDKGTQFWCRGFHWA